MAKVIICVTFGAAYMFGMDNDAPLMTMIFGFSCLYAGFSVLEAD